MKKKSIVCDVFVLVKLNNKLIIYFNLKLSFDKNYLPNNPYCTYCLFFRKKIILSVVYIYYYTYNY